MAGHRWQNGACALHAGYLRLQIYALRLCNNHCNNGCTNAPQYYVIRTFPALFDSQTDKTALQFHIKNNKDKWIKRDQRDVTCSIISLFNAQHVSDVNTSILRSLRLICWVISWVVFSFGCIQCFSRMQAEALFQPAYGYHTTPAKPQRNTNTHRTRAIQHMK